MSVSELFEPIKKSHAIAETIFFFEFANRLIANQKKMESLKSNLADLFSEFDETKSVQITLENSETPSIQQNSDAIQMVRRNATSNALEWIVRIAGPSISIHCLEYYRWAPAKQFFLDVLKRVLEALDTQEPLLGGGLRVLDRFRFMPSAGKYNISELLDPESVYVSDHVFSSGERWHVYTGWFEPGKLESTEVLSQLNLDSSYTTSSDGELQSFVTLDHTLSLRDSENKVSKSPLGALSDGKKVLDSASELFEAFHLCNKSVIFNVLNKKIAEQMNLRQGGA
ncbi:TIGR04255 family protein [Pseudomonas sp. GCEP-101]|uniref:TIGR04255 family protein n=1 Tax=Pseudomonas sp. GCEP-101 TaxID=2974552 RepID=UPI00223AB402|nr:TIGR04255 family protein [Pseudomonas sp. GCEP-101]